VKSSGVAVAFPVTGVELSDPPELSPPVSPDPPELAVMNLSFVTLLLPAG